MKQYEIHSLRMNTKHEIDSEKCAIKYKQEKFLAKNFRQKKWTQFKIESIFKNLNTTTIVF